MSHLRKDPLVKRWVVVATKRRHRPRKVEECPFCPGNEGLTPPEVLRIPEKKDWQVRVVPNLFPILGDHGETTRSPFYRSRPGKGFHEIIIETPLHNRHIAELELNNLKLVLDTYQHRLREFNDLSWIRYTLIFKNYGRRAGASLKHSHSQVVAMPLLPKRVAEELTSAKAYYRRHRRCLFCQIIAEEKETEDRIIVSNRHYLAFVPYAARIPYEIWIMPIRHQAYFDRVSDDEKFAFAEIIQSCLKRLVKVLDDPPFNFFLHTGPNHLDAGDYYHYHLVIMPVTTILGGFELGSGFYVNQSLAEEDAQRLREAG
ncbi:galactose-1-phosphate uridylyltransferase [candidate division WOR-3 bacterium]|uniref:Galactose-1-phosphate uridylyltransferase n=1 Tax=candidate division WOR-3 bacterium TaxID=2052148 RepID=A0A660SH57_UNCW3|nr:MAG: galactose-1-phosphate uridylyltransferase [candidate division WOR-3 bacterium]